MEHRNFKATDIQNFLTAVKDIAIANGVEELGEALVNKFILIIDTEKLTGEEAERIITVVDEFLQNIADRKILPYEFISIFNDAKFAIEDLAELNKEISVNGALQMRVEMVKTIFSSSTQSPKHGDLSNFIATKISEEEQNRIQIGPAAVSGVPIDFPIFRISMGGESFYYPTHEENSQDASSFQVSVNINPLIYTNEHSFNSVADAKKAYDDCRLARAGEYSTIKFESVIKDYFNECLNQIKGDSRTAFDGKLIFRSYFTEYPLLKIGDKTSTFFSNSDMHFLLLSSLKKNLVWLTKSEIPKFLSFFIDLAANADIDWYAFHANPTQSLNTSHYQKIEECLDDFITLKQMGFIERIKFKYVFIQWVIKRFILGDAEFKTLCNGDHFIPKSIEAILQDMRSLRDAFKGFRDDLIKNKQFK